MIALGSYKSNIIVYYVHLEGYNRDCRKSNHVLMSVQLASEMARKEAESAELEQQLIKAKREQLEHTQVCIYLCTFGSFYRFF